MNKVRIKRAGISCVFFSDSASAKSVNDSGENTVKKLYVFSIWKIKSISHAIRIIIFARPAPSASNKMSRVANSAGVYAAKNGPSSFPE